MEVTGRRVMLLKAPAEDRDEAQPDPYSQLLQDNGFTVTYIPVIDFEYCNLEQLRDCLRAPDKFSGIIFTSPRAVQATVLCTDAGQHPLVHWTRHSFYVVGRTTADVLRANLRVEGEGAESGSASNLADYITLRTHAHPLLYPCSSLQKGTLPTRLRDGGVDTHCITAYKTVAHPNLEQNLRQADTPHFIAYFSPSGVTVSLPLLQGLHLPLHRVKIIAIGAATKAALEKSDVRVWSVCKEPTPDHLLSELLSLCSS